MNGTIEQKTQAEDQPDSKDDVPERQAVTSFGHRTTVANIDGNNRRHTSLRRYTTCSADRLVRPMEQPERVGWCGQF